MTCALGRADEAKPFAFESLELEGKVEPGWLDGRVELASFFPESSGVVDDDAAQEWRFDPEGGQYWLKLARATGFGEWPNMEPVSPRQKSSIP